MKKWALGLMTVAGLTACGGQPAPSQTSALTDGTNGMWEVSLTMTQAGDRVALSNTVVKMLSGATTPSGALTLSGDKVTVTGSTVSGELTVVTPSYQARCAGRFLQKTAWEYVSNQCTFLQSDADLNGATFEVGLLQH